MRFDLLHLMTALSWVLGARMSQSVQRDSL